MVTMFDAPGRVRRFAGTRQYPSALHRCAWRLAGFAFFAGILFAMLPGSSGAATTCEMPPLLVDPIVYRDLCPGDTGFPTIVSAGGRDVYIQLPKDRACTKRLLVKGAQNVRIFGGAFDYNDSASDVLAVRNSSGTTFLEGLQINVNGLSANAISSYAHTGRMVVQNTLVRGVSGSAGGTLRQAIDAQGRGPLAGLILQNVTMLTSGRGLYAYYGPNNGRGARKLKLDRVNAAYDPTLPKWPEGTTPPKGLYYIGSPTSARIQAPPEGTALTEVYADGSHWGLPYQKTVYVPPKPQPDGCANFTSDKLSGKVCLGPPPGGDFAPASRVGLAYDRSSFCGVEPMPSNLEAPPAMDPGYLLVEDVCPEDPRWPTADQSAGRDIKVVLPKDRVCQPNRGSDGRLQAILGGTATNPAKDIWVVGGQIENKWGQGPGDVDFGAAGLRFQYWSGTAFVEGVHIDMKCTCEDAINSLYVSGTTARMVIQNSFLTGYVQCTPGTHGDAFHAQGAGGQRHELKMQNVWSQMTFQGIMVDPRIKATPAGHGVSRLELDRFYLERHPTCQSFGQQGYGWRIYWQNSQGDPPPEKGVWFNEAYFTSYNDAYFSSPAPTSWDADGCAVYPPEAGVRAGKACLGAPPNGPPVSLDRIGLNYDRSSFTGQP